MSLELYSSLNKLAHLSRKRFIILKVKKIMNRLHWHKEI